jgi:hypothetical protein
MTPRTAAPCVAPAGYARSGRSTRHRCLSWTLGRPSGGTPHDCTRPSAMGSAAARRPALGHLCPRRRKDRLCALRRPSSRALGSLQSRRDVPVDPYPPACHARRLPQRPLDRNSNPLARGVPRRAPPSAVLSNTSFHARRLVARGSRRPTSAASSAVFRARKKASVGPTGACIFIQRNGPRRAPYLGSSSHDQSLPRTVAPARSRRSAAAGLPSRRPVRAPLRRF